jgi:hypothetical protein
VVWVLKDSGVSVSPTGPESATGRALIGPRPGRGRPESAIEVEPGKMEEQTVAGYGVWLLASLESRETGKLAATPKIQF